MMNTREKVNRNLAGLQYLLSRPDTRSMHALVKKLKEQADSPAFFVGRAIMRDGLTVIQISLRVNVTTFGVHEETYRDEYVQGRGTTFEMALFDLSANLVKTIGENDYIFTESVPVIDEREYHGHEKDTDTGVCADKPGAVGDAVADTERNVKGRLAARSDRTGGGRKNTRGPVKPGGKGATGRGGRGRIKRAGR